MLKLYFRLILGQFLINIWSSIPGEFKVDIVGFSNRTLSFTLKMPGGMKRQWPSLPTTTFVWYVPSNFSSALKRWTFWKNGQKRQISYQIFFMLCCWKLIEHSHSNWNLERLPLFHIQGHTSFRYKGFNASRSCTSQNIKIYIQYFKRLIFELSQESHLLSWYSNWT